MGAGKRAGFCRLSWQRLAGLTAIASILAGCSDVRLAKIEKQDIVNGMGKLCLTDPDEIRRFTKFLFVIDKSGSNDETDPGGDKRAGAIQKFLTDHSGNTHFQYGMIYFQDSAAGGYIGSDSSPTFTPDVNEALQAADEFRSGDEGLTPYIAALEKARQAIRNDISKHPDEDNTYMILFVSDGSPQPALEQPDSDIFDLVENIVGIDPSRVFLSTGFYGTDTDGEVARLKKMAKLGNGNFVNLEKQASWDFGSFLNDEQLQPWQIQYELVIYNLNAGFCEGGAVDVDSDGDGLCDIDEKRYGYNPRNRFSMGDGYGDYFHALDARLTPCADQTDEDHDLLTTCEEAYIHNEHPFPVGTPKFGDRKTPDTDRDGILDGIETFAFAFNAIGGAMDSENLKIAYDGEPARTRILKHQNPRYHHSPSPAYDVSLRPIVGDPGCFQYHQSVLPLENTLKVEAADTLPGLDHQAHENVILVYFMQTHLRDPNGDGYYRYSLQKLMNDAPTQALVGHSAALKFEPERFQSYKFKLGSKK